MDSVDTSIIRIAEMAAIRDDLRLFGIGTDIDNLGLYVANVGRARGQNLVVDLERVLYVDAQLALGQIPDVARGGLHGVALPEVLVYGFGFGGRLNNDEAIWQDEKSFFLGLSDVFSFLGYA